MSHRRPPGTSRSIGVSAPLPAAVGVEGA